MDKFEDVRTEKGGERCCDGADISADPISKALRVCGIPTSGPAYLVYQGLERRVIGIAKRVEKFRLGFQRGWGGCHKGGGISLQRFDGA